MLNVLFQQFLEMFFSNFKNPCYCRVEIFCDKY